MPVQWWGGETGQQCDWGGAGELGHGHRCVGFCHDSLQSELAVSLPFTVLADYMRGVITWEGEFFEMGCVSLPAICMVVIILCSV